MSFNSETPSVGEDAIARATSHEAEDRFRRIELYRMHVSICLDCADEGRRMCDQGYRILLEALSSCPK